jgi:DNA-nicking Smr family endonuclease
MTKNSIKSHKVNNKKCSKDQEIWEQVTASIKPLRSSLKNRVLEKEIWPTSHSTHVKFTKHTHSISLRSDQLLRPPPLPELRHGTTTGLDKRNAKKLRKGQHAIEGQLDLHGMTQGSAHVAINNFIEVSCLAGKRCVLIITGKGLKIEGAVGVLRLAVPRWLNEKPNRSRVLAFSYATPRDGGEGALYVMLRRKR